MRPAPLLLPLARPSAASEPDQPSPHLLAELLALNEEMIEQLCLERVTGGGDAEFLTSLINQHEKTADLLRTQLACLAPARPEIKAELTRVFRTG